MYIVTDILLSMEVRKQCFNNSFFTLVETIQNFEHKTVGRTQVLFMEQEKKNYKIKPTTTF